MEALPPGTVLGGYRIEALVGSGTLGSVYRATQLDLQRPVALKVLAQQWSSDSEFRERFMRECHIAASIHHPNVIPVYAVTLGQADGRLMVAMRFVEGTDLGVLIAHEGRLESGRAARVVAQVAAALDAMHERGLVHRDLKSADVLIADAPEPEHVYVAPFTSRPDSRVHSTTEAFEPDYIDYIAPEEIQGAPVDARANVYALGAILYESVTGQVPFPAPTVAAKLWGHMAEPIPDVRLAAPDAPVGLGDVLRRAMAKRPEERYPSAGDLARAVLATAEGGQARAARSVAVDSSPPAFGRPAPSSPPPPSAVPPAPYAAPYPAPGPSPTKARAGWWRRRRERRDQSARQFPPLAAAPPPPPPPPPLQLPVLRDGDPSADAVQCSVYAPSRMAFGGAVLVQAFAHLIAQADDAHALAQEFDVEARRRGVRTLDVPIRRGSRLGFDLAMPPLEVEDPIRTMVWHGRPEAVQFAVRTPANITVPSVVVGSITLSCDGVPAGHVTFRLDVVSPQAPPLAAPDSSEPVGEALRYRSAFISYATPDRPKVLERVQVLQALGIEYFQDLLNLDPGDRWQHRLQEGIDDCDVFLLFWSSAAKESEWVRREVTYALARKAGGDHLSPAIRPLIIEGPPVALPWEELAHMHFDDRLLHLMS